MNKDQSSNSHDLNRSTNRVDPLTRLRGYRVHRDRARGLGDDLAYEMRGMKKVSDSESAALEAWNTVAPDHVLDIAQVAGLKAGKLIVMVPSASMRHVVDRWLKSGGFHEFQTLARVPVCGVMLKIAPYTSP